MRRAHMMGALVVVLSSIASATTGAQPLSADAAKALVAKQGYADTIAVNGNVISVDDKGYNTNPGRIYEAMAIKRDRIMALGTSQEMRTLADSNTTVIDLMGQTVLPGIIESHVHIYGDPAELARRGIGFPPQGKRISVTASKDKETTHRLVENAIRDEVKTLANGDWLMVNIAGNLKDDLPQPRVFAWTTQGDFTKLDFLDGLAPKNPVLVSAGTKTNINTAGLTMMRKFFPNLDEYYEAALPDNPNATRKGVIGIEGTTALTWNIWYEKLPTSLLAEVTAKALERTAAHGYTTFSTRLPNPRVIDVYSFLTREGYMPMRLAGLMEGHRMPEKPEITRAIYTLTGNLTGVGNDYFWFHGVASELWDSDYPTICYGPDLPAPPAIKAREMCPGPGMLYYDTLRNAFAAGWRLAGVHGMASNGVRIFLNLLDSVAKEKGWSDEYVRSTRPTIEHAPATGALPDVVEKLKRFGVIVSAHPVRFYWRASEHIRDYGPAAEAFQLPLKTLLDQGVKVVGQTEATSGIGWIWSILMNRKDYKGTVVGGREALDRVVVLKMWTNWASEYVMKEKDLGSLEVGKLADFVVIDKDYLTIPVDDMQNIRPVATVVGGKMIALQADYASKLGRQPIGYQFPAGYKPWGEPPHPAGY